MLLFFLFVLDTHDSIVSLFFSMCLCRDEDWEID